jgi:hypothetical protein
MAPLGAGQDPQPRARELPNGERRPTVGICSVERASRTSSAAFEPDMRNLATSHETVDTNPSRSKPRRRSTVASRLSTSASSASPAVNSSARSSSIAASGQDPTSSDFNSSMADRSVPMHLSLPNICSAGQ